MTGDNTDTTSSPTATGTVLSTTSPPTANIVTPSTTSSATLNLGVTDTSTTDIRVSWIYQLKKDDLTIELAKFGLDTTGTVEVLRRRLINFIRLGRATPAPTTQAFAFSPPTTSTALTTTVTIPTVTVQQPISTPLAGSTLPTSNPNLAPLKIHKWNVHFNGRTDPVNFIERLQEICTSQGIPIDRLLPHMSELLQGEASLWFRNNRSHWHTWSEFLQDFRSFYFPINYAADLEIEISRRLQKPNEPTHRYITDLQTLIRRHGNLTPDQELQWLYRNLLPEYRQHIRPYEVNDVVSLSRRIREVESLLAELCATPPTSTPRHTYRPTAGLSAAQPPTQDSPSGRIRPSTGNQRPVNPPPHSRNKKPASSYITVGRDMCWRCGESGHFRTECQGTPRRFCSRCGKTDVLSRDCQCQRTGN